MGISKSIEDAIEKEIETRVQERIEGILKMISTNYNIKFDRLLKDLGTVKTTESSTKICCGVLKTGGKCKAKANCGNYCKRHQDQKPITKKIPVSEETVQSPFLNGLQNALRKQDPP